MGHFPIIILGSERSGTNLLRAILQSHSMIASPPPAGFIDALMPIQMRYFPEGKPAHLMQLIEDIIVMTKMHHNPWDVPLSPINIKARLNDQTSFLEIFRAINDIYAESKGRPLWASKEPGLFKHIREIADYLPSAKFVYLVRDGRDVAASMLLGHLHEFHIYYAALNWANTQRLCLAAMTDPVVSPRIHLLKYENLIENPEKEVSSMMEFIGVPYESSQLNFHNNKSVVEHASKSRLWKNLAKPIDDKNKGLYKSRLSFKDIRLFEAIGQAEMNALGYQVETSADLVINSLDIKYFEFLSRMKRLIWKLDPRAEARRSRRRSAITWQIINRNLV